MKEFDWSKVRADKEASRDRRTNLSYADKLRMLDRLRERSLAMRGATPVSPSTVVRNHKAGGAERKK